METLNIPHSIILKIQSLDSITLNHSVRVQNIARKFEEYNRHDNNILSMAGLVHDIGKMYISSKIIDKPGMLTPIEREIINLHPYISYKILIAEDVDPSICLLALLHHGMNPPGYKHSRFGEDQYVAVKDRWNLDLEAVRDYSKMLHTIDCYEALTSDRPYRRGFSPEKAIEILDSEENQHEKVLEFLHKTF